MKNSASVPLFPRCPETIVSSSPPSSSYTASRPPDATPSCCRSGNRRAFGGVLRGVGSPGLRATPGLPFGVGGNIDQQRYMLTLAGRRLMRQDGGMVWVAGADGCKKSWFRASRETETGELHFHVVEHASRLLEVLPRPTVLALDIPIGLSEAGPRDCDRLARQCLRWPRRNSVFPAPIRPALQAETREEASRVTALRDGRKVGTQAWALYPKIRDVDELLQTSPEARRRIREVHPEVCFWSWASGHPMAAGKKTRAGKARRSKLAEGWLGPDVVVLGRGNHPKKHVADDDILDAIAALWTATRIVHGEAQTLPKSPPVDSTGFPMEIVY